MEQAALHRATHCDKTRRSRAKGGWVGKVAIAFAVACGFTVAGAAGQNTGTSDDSVTVKTVGGAEIRTNQLSIDEDGMVAGVGVPEETTVEDLRSIRFSTLGASSRGPYQVRLRGGSFLYVSNLVIADEQCRFQYAGEVYALPIESLRAVQLDTSREAEAFEKGAAEPLPERDRLYLKIDDQLQSVTGIVESVGAGSITFLFDDQTRELRMDQAFGFVVADFEAEAVETGNVQVELTDGSRLLGSLAALSNESLRVNLGESTELAVALNMVSSVELKSDRLRFLSDVDPLRSEMNPIVTLPREWQRDRSVSGNPLRLFDGESDAVITYEKGIGTHAESVLEFENVGGFDRFVAVIGIDAETKGKGDCQFVVMGDGEKLFERRVRGTDSPFPIDVEVTGRKTISLIVLAGEQLDLADHANWCEARFLKSRNATE